MSADATDTPLFAPSVYQAALAADATTEISQRVVTGEPMSIIMNLGQSTGFTTVNYTALTYPATMRIDYVRVYQKAGAVDALTCDPPDFPTAGEWRSSLRRGATRATAGWLTSTGLRPFL